MSTDGERWQHVKTIFNDALERPDTERAAFVDDACRDDDALRNEVHRLLDLHHQPGDVLEPPEVGRAVSTSLVGERIGHYRVTRVIASGGMGTVYEAEQESPRRTVALKVLQQGLESPTHRTRFEYEVQVLGRLQHPGIAQVFEAGTFESDGRTRPWFAMELIDGRPLIEFADGEGLDIRRRLTLLAKLCDAVHYAHQKGVIHRDLKPANILVDANGQPKILDFGVARVTDADMQATMHTAVGELVGTISYMSPEQVAADPDRLDTRLDVYALGVIAFEMLSGRLPYDLAGKSIPQAALIILEDDPTTLSALDRVYRGDLETIVGKTLEKDPQRRYASAADLGADIRRHLADEPITARPPTTMYQLVKFARRNRALVAAVAAVFAALLIGLVVALDQGRAGPAAAADDARYEAEKARAVTNFLTNDFITNLLREVGGAEGMASATELTDRASATVGTQFAGDPRGEAAVRNEIGTIYYALGDFPRAEIEFGRCLDLWQAELGPDHPDTLKGVANQGLAIFRQGRNDEAEVLYRRAYETRLRVLGEDDFYTLASMNNLSTLLTRTGRPGEAEPLLRRAIAVQKRLLGPQHKHTLTSMLNLGAIHRDRGDFAAAAALQREAVDGLAATFGPEHVSTLLATNALATTLDEIDVEEAIDMHRRVAATLARVLSDTHPDTLTAEHDLVRALARSGRAEEAATICRDAVARAEAAHGPDNELVKLLRERLSGLTATDR